jgi:BlaI family transcriptional regulator, penicillinase repressor
VQDSVGLTGLQLSILDVLWEAGEATTQQVWEGLNVERSLALTTVATLLSRLEKKAVLTHRREGRQYVYRATVSRSEVRRSKVRELTETLFGGDATALLSHLVRADDVETEELERIRHEIVEVGEDLDLTGHPADDRQFERQNAEGREREADQSPPRAGDGLGLCGRVSF